MLHAPRRLPWVRLAIGSVLICLATPGSRGDPATPLKALARMPVREVTVFKDGHAFVLHTGTMPTDAQGNVVLDALPQPVLGTFWPYSADPKVRLTAVTASTRKVLLDRTALSLRELIEANIGSAVTITETPVNAGRETPPVTYTATIESVPTQSGEELEATSPPNSGDKLSVKGNVVILRTNSGFKAVDFSRILDVSFPKAPNTALGREEFRNLLTLRLDWNGKAPAKEARVGMVYLQKGIRWIPNYKVTIDGGGQATVQLQATIINELTDLEDCTTHLVIGVPSFMFASTLDPIALQQTAAQLSAYFVRQGGIDSNIASNFDNGQFAFSNSIMTQTQRVAEPQARVAPGGGGGGAPDLGPDVPAGARAEDLFLFTVRKLTLKKGQRTTLTVATYSVKYKDVYTLDVPVTPPPEVFRHFDDARKAEVARMLSSPKVQHKVRLFNGTKAPFTTAPALILKRGGDKEAAANAAEATTIARAADDAGAQGQPKPAPQARPAADDPTDPGRLIAQGMMTYTAPGAAVDLDLTAAVDVSVAKADHETGRVPKAERWNGDDYMRIDLAGKITLTSYAKAPMEVEVQRHIMGNLDAADHDGKLRSLNLLEDSSYAPTSASGAVGGFPIWYRWYNWPYWWSRFNTIGRVTWNVTLEPEKPVELGYTWHYFWR